MHVFLQDQPFPNIRCKDADFESINLTRYYANLHKKCVYSTPVCIYSDSSEKHLNFYGIEPLMYWKWSTLYPTKKTAKEADMIVFLSLNAYCGGSIFGHGHFDPTQPNLKDSVYKSYLDNIESMLGMNQLGIIHFDGAWGDTIGKMFLQYLSKRSLRFQHKLIIATIEDPNEMSAFVYGVPESKFIVVPYSIMTENKYRMNYKKRPIMALFEGRPHASFDNGRFRLLNQISRDGMICDKNWKNTTNSVTCIVCAKRNRQHCYELMKQRLKMCNIDDPCAESSFFMAHHSRFCFEPTSDELIRSHFYIALNSACIPVIVDGHYEKNGTMSMEPTRWAWRNIIDYNKIVVKLNITDRFDDLINRISRTNIRLKNIQKSSTIMRYSAYGKNDAFGEFYKVVRKHSTYLKII